MRVSDLQGRIEFSNNGLTDSLTGTIAPRIFFTNLTRELARSKRKFQPISIMTIRLMELERNQSKPAMQNIPSAKIGNNGTMAESNLASGNKVLSKKVVAPSNKILSKKVVAPSKTDIQNKRKQDSIFEKQLIAISKTLKSTIRSSDFFSRIAENGFWICLSADKEEVDKSMVRIANNLEGKFKGVSLEIWTQEWDGKLDQSNWIQNIDREFFKSHH